MASRSVSIYCPHCHQRTSVEPALIPIMHKWDRWYQACIWEKNEKEKWWLGVCNYCQLPVLVLNMGEKVLPNPSPKPTDKSIPTEIRSDLVEAKKCFSVSAWRGAAVLARRAMQSAAIDKGATKKNLAEQMAELQIKGTITVDLREWTDVVRWVGNDAAHPGSEDVTEDDAKDILSLAEQFLHVLYVTPAKAKALRQKKGR